MYGEAETFAHLAAGGAATAQILDDAAGLDDHLCVARGENPARQVDRLVAVPATPIAHWLDRLQVQAVLVRPDRYLAGTALDREDLKALLSGHAARCFRARCDAAPKMTSAR